MERIKTALIGLGDVGSAYAEAILADKRFDLIAVGDPGDKLLRRTTESIPAKAYNDYRSLIVETGCSSRWLRFAPSSSSTWRRSTASVCFTSRLPPGISMRPSSS